MRFTYLLLLTLILSISLVFTLGSAFQWDNKYFRKDIGEDLK